MYAVNTQHNYRAHRDPIVPLAFDAINRQWFQSANAHTVCTSKATHTPTTLQLPSLILSLQDFLISATLFIALSLLAILPASKHTPPFHHRHFSSRSLPTSMSYEHWISACKISLATKISARVRLEHDTKRASSGVTPGDGNELQVGYLCYALRVVITVATIFVNLVPPTHPACFSVSSLLRHPLTPVFYATKQGWSRRSRHLVSNFKAQLCPSTASATVHENQLETFTTKTQKKSIDDTYVISRRYP